jgi:hypothetical protein
MNEMKKARNQLLECDLLMNEREQAKSQLLD